MDVGLRKRRTGGGVAQPGRAAVSKTARRGFKSRHLHYLQENTPYGVHSCPLFREQVELRV